MVGAAFIRKGQRAWTAIKATAEEQRTLWLEVGVALMYGKQKENRPVGLKFSEWAAAMFPGLGINDAADAIWLAEDFTNRVKNVPAGISHPKGIRAAFNEQADASPPWDTPEDEPKATTVPKFDSQRDAEKFIKVDQRTSTMPPRRR